jgi:peroxin-3
MDRRREDERKRNRPGLVSLVTTAVLAYGTYRLVDWVWKQSGTEVDEDEVKTNQDIRNRQQNVHTRPAARGSAESSSQQRWRMRRQRMTRCREEVLNAVEGFLPTMRRILDERTSTRAEASGMKALRSHSTEVQSPVTDQITNDQIHRREQEQELWSKIQLKLLTRMLATAYVHTILFLVLTVQVNLLGSRLLEEQLGSGGQSPSLASVGPDGVASDRMGSYQASHRFVLLHTYDNFFEHGLLSLIITVERAVSDALASNKERWNVFDRCSLNWSKELMEEMIETIRTSIEEGRACHSSRRSSRPPRSLFRFLMPPSAHVETPMDDEMAASILDETWDLVESPVMLDAQRDCLNTTFDILRDQHWGDLFATTTGDCSGWTTKPLAAVIPRLKHAAASFYAQHGNASPTDRNARGQTAFNSYCSMMQALPSVLELADVSFN